MNLVKYIRTFLPARSRLSRQAEANSPVFATRGLFFTRKLTRRVSRKREISVMVVDNTRIPRTTWMFVNPALHSAYLSLKKKKEEKGN